MVGFQVNAASPSTIIIVANAIMKSESLSVVQQRIMVEKLLQNLNLSSQSKLVFAHLSLLLVLFNFDAETTFLFFFLFLLCV